MNKRTITVIIWISFAAMIGYSCSGKNYHQYPMERETPKAVYMDTQINEIWNRLEKMHKNSFIETVTTQGERQSGKLAVVSEKALTLHRGYTLKEAAGSPAKRTEKSVQVNRQQIIMVRVW